MRTRKKVAIASAAVLAIAAGAGGAVVFAGPAAPPVGAQALQPVPADEHARTIAAMKPPKRARPVVAVIGANAGTETTDYIIPYAVLAESRAADVLALGTARGRLQFRPALAIRPQATTADFDARYPDGADYVIVPAINDRDDPVMIAWIRAQAAKGATIVAVCAGAVTVSEAGLLAGRDATGHWYDVQRLRKANPTMRWVPDRRYVADRGVVTTTGVSASLPVSLALVEAIAGRERAAAVAREFGVDSWDARHESSAYRFHRGMKREAYGNRFALWNRETYGVAVAPGVDEVALAFTADAWARTFRTSAVAISDRGEPIQTRRGLTLLPDQAAGEKPVDAMVTPPPSAKAAATLPLALEGIAKRYGARTAEFVALQLEYSWRAPAQAGTAGKGK